MHRPESTYEMVMLERNLLEVCLKEWEKLPVMGKSYSPHIQKEVGYQYQKTYACIA